MAKTDASGLGWGAVTHMHVANKAKGFELVQICMHAVVWGLDHTHRTHTHTHTQ